MSPGSTGATARVFAALADAGIDAAVLGRQDNTTWATGMHRLWTAGTRPFGAGCVLVPATEDVHLLSSWDDSIPDSVPFDHLYGVTWNPAIMAEEMAAIPGLAGATTIGVDALSPGFRKAAARFAPDARLRPVDDLLASLRRAKSDDQVDRIRTACAVARSGLDAVSEALAGGDKVAGEGAPGPGVLRGGALEALARAGATIPSSGVRVSVDAGSTTVDVGVLVDDWEGGVGRTLGADGSPRGGRTEERVHALIAACEAGANGRRIQACAGDDPWLVRGVGMGFEHPVVGPVVGSDVELVDGDVLSVEVSGPGRHHREVLVVTSDAPEILT